LKGHKRQALCPFDLLCELAHKVKYEKALCMAILAGVLTKELVLEHFNRMQGFDFARFSKDKTLFYFESTDQKSIPEIRIINSLSR